MKLVEYIDTEGKTRLVPELFKRILDHVSEMDFNDPKEVAGLDRFVEKLKELSAHNNEVIRSQEIIDNFENGICSYCSSDDVECLEDCTIHKCIDCGLNN